jgi:hypothetical protein
VLGELRRIEPLAERRCRLNAATLARFPRLHGGAYRMLVVGTGGLGLAIRRLLAAARRRAEAGARL